VDQATHNKIVSFIWAIADDELRDLKSRGKRRSLRTLVETSANVLAIEKEAEGLPERLFVEAAQA
jgi:hypothetical protein